MRKYIFCITIIISLISVNFKAQTKAKDTLFFKFDKNYIVTYDVTPDKYYLLDSNSGGTFYFERKESHYNLKPNKVKNLKDFIHN